MTKKQLKHRLKLWGDFWARKRLGAGYASKSTTSRICETLQTQVYTVGTSYLVSDKSDNIHVPEHIQEIDSVLHELTIKERESLKKKYQQNKFVDSLHLTMAENKILGLI